LQLRFIPSLTHVSLCLLGGETQAHTWDVLVIGMMVMGTMD